MSEQLPSLSSLRAFEAAARHLSMTRAGEELHVTAGAVSLQVRELEANLGLALFERHPRRLELTAAGQDYATALRSAFRLIRQATDTVRAHARPDIVTLSCTTGFAVHWLMPRLDAFQAAHPAIDLRFGTTARLVDFRADSVALAVRHGLGAYPGLISEKLVKDDLVVVASPERAARLGPEPAARQLSDETLIHDAGRNDWRLWLEAEGALDVDWRRGPVIAPDSNGAIETARAGLGFALVRESFAAADLAAGRLVAPFRRSIASRFAYYLVYPPDALDRASVRTVRDWLRAEADHV
ncbi:transcriptional regulator, LysR family [Rhizobium sp. RU35A]|uniref:transcriptional regulator GcvA n=1 Tax=Rhizobium sp. RU35A TaxID=1907414 RepID=UPI0009572A72|nr:transcriptional regulator GcvA [Rhizobium sp. RU35A]SIR12554.1 transcriptional regulator, LysR family [Rhizobium sp. RU35A]